MSESQNRTRRATLDPDSPTGWSYDGLPYTPGGTEVVGLAVARLLTGLLIVAGGFLIGFLLEVR